MTDSGIRGEDMSPERLADVIGLTGIKIPAAVVATWTVREREEAGRWAAAEHLHASDNTGVKRLGKPGVVLAAEQMAANPAVAQIVTEQWTALLEHAEEFPETYACQAAQTVLGTARAAITGLLVLVDGRQPAWQERAMQVLREHPRGTRTVDLAALLGQSGPSWDELTRWLAAGEDAGTLDEIMPDTWRVREKRR